MMQEARRTAEVAIMNKYLLQFSAFKTENGRVGFYGSCADRARDASTASSSRSRRKATRIG